MSKRLKNKKGFTLVELLVVISIIGILSSLSMVSVNIARQRARDAKRKADIAQVVLALYLYFDDTLEFPETPSMDPDPVEGAENWEEILTPALNGTGPISEEVYMGQVPFDPLNRDQHIYSYYLEGDGPKEIHGY
jgi:prepilin-type N-terminal cleavage/methylation domain-containing protein